MDDEVEYAKLASEPTFLKRLGFWHVSSELAFILVVVAAVAGFAAGFWFYP